MAAPVQLFAPVLFVSIRPLPLSRRSCSLSSKLESLNSVLTLPTPTPFLIAFRFVHQNHTFSTHTRTIITQPHYTIHMPPSPTSAQNFGTQKKNIRLPPWANSTKYTVHIAPSNILFMRQASKKKYTKWTKNERATLISLVAAYYYRQPLSTVNFHENDCVPIIFKP